MLPLPLLEARVGLFVLQCDGCCTVIQTSVSALTAHSSTEDIIGIARRYGFVVGSSLPHAAAPASATASASDALVGFASTALASSSTASCTTAAVLERYIFVTVKPQKHTGLAKDDGGHVRIVELFGL